MPIEIKELIVRAIITDDDTLASKQENDFTEQEQIISACVEQVLNILEKSKER